MSGEFAVTERIEWHITDDYAKRAIIAFGIACCCLILVYGLLILWGILPMFTMVFAGLGLLISGCVGFFVIIPMFPNMIGLANDKILLKYEKKTREIPWDEISRCILPEKGKGHKKIITNEGEIIPLPLISDDLANRILEFWESKT